VEQRCAVLEFKKYIDWVNTQRLENMWEHSPSRVLFLSDVQLAYEMGDPIRVRSANIGPKAQFRIRSSTGGGVTSGAAAWLGDGVHAGRAVDVDGGDDAGRALVVVHSASKVAGDRTTPSTISVEMPKEDGAADPADRCCHRSSSSLAVSYDVCTVPQATMRESTGGTGFVTSAEATMGKEVWDGGAAATGDAPQLEVVSCRWCWK